MYNKAKLCGVLSIQHYDRELHPETRGQGLDRYFLQCIRVIVHEPVVERRYTLVAGPTTVVAEPTAVERDRGQAAIETVGDSERRQSDVVVAAATTPVLLPPQPHERCTLLYFIILIMFYLPIAQIIIHDKQNNIITMVSK